MAFIEMNSNLKFLIIDSQLASATSFKLDLVKIGYRNSIVIDDEVKAFAHIKAEPVDFIFCRQNLPKISGTEFLEELKGDFNISRKPFITYMEKTDKEDVALMSEAGADNLLIVPYNIKDLAERVTSNWAKYMAKDNPDVLYENGRKLFLQKQYKEADAIFKSLIDKKHLTSLAKIGQIRLRLAQDQKVEALQLAKSLVSEFPNQVLANHWLGEIYSAMNQGKDAAAWFNKAITLSPKNPVRYQRISEILSTLNEWEAIVAILKQAEEKKLSYNFVEEGLARALIKLGRKEEAIEYYRILVKRNPKTANYCNNIAVCYKGLNNFNKAVQYLNQGLESEPENISILFNLALIWAQKGKNEKAIERLEQVLKIDPKFEKAKVKLDQLNGAAPQKKSA